MFSFHEEEMYFDGKWTATLIFFSITLFLKWEKPLHCEEIDKN